jgi:hypothetical protein
MLPRSIAEFLSTPNAINIGFSFAAFAIILSTAETGSLRSANYRPSQMRDDELAALEGYDGKLIIS